MAIIILYDFKSWFHTIKYDENFSETNTINQITNFDNRYCEKYGMLRARKNRS